jgi:hypothetical protein
MTPEELRLLVEEIYQGIKGSVSMFDIALGNRKSPRSKIKEGVKAAAGEGVTFGANLGRLQESIAG